MVINVDKFNTPAEHASIDHTGLTGVNSFDSTAHSGTDHAGITGTDETNAQLNGGASQGPQPTLNFIHAVGAAGITVVDNPGLNRIDITITTPTIPAATTVTGNMQLGTVAPPAGFQSNTVTGTLRLAIYFGHQSAGVSSWGAATSGNPGAISAGGVRVTNKVLVNESSQGVNLTSFAGNAVGVTHDSNGTLWEWIFMGVGQN